jgi:hypothetical protein
VVDIDQGRSAVAKGSGELLHEELQKFHDASL